MTAMDFVSQPIGRYGDITGSGLRNLMGAPDKGQLEIVIREAVQNSWDARLEGKESVRIQVEHLTLRPRARQQWEAEVPSPPIASGLRRSAPERLLVLRDLQTKGLAGPVRPDEVSEGGPADFVNFVFMVGETKDGQEQAGGTYGYGRSSFFVESERATVFVYSRCKVRGRAQSRLIGIAWTPKFTMRGRTYTGRHWWGKQSGEGILPLVGKSADEMAVRLGIAEGPLKTTGTMVAILDPLHTSSKEEALQRVRSALLWNCWPHIVDNSIKFELIWEGRRETLNDLEGDPRLELYGSAYKSRGTIAGRRDSSARHLSDTLQSRSPRAKLGRLSLRRRAWSPGADFIRGPLDSDDQIEPTITRHVALLRAPRIVVDYLECPAPPEGQHYAGVFVANEDFDEIFARAEPPSHDAWIHRKLEQHREKVVVNQSLVQTRETVKHWLGSTSSSTGTVDTTPLGPISDFLGSLVGATAGDGSGDGPSGPDRGGGGGSRRSHRRPVEITALERKVVQGGIELTVTLVAIGDRDERVVISSRPRVLVDRGGGEREMPLGAMVPSVIDWRSGKEMLFGKADFAVAAGAETVLRVFQPSDVVLDLRLSAKVVAS